MLKTDNFIRFNQTNSLAKNPLRHSFFFNGMDSLRQVESESAHQFSQNVEKIIYNASAGSGKPFERGFYTSFRGNV